jgi:hypothetical protein
MALYNDLLTFTQGEMGAKKVKRQDFLIEVFAFLNSQQIPTTSSNFRYAFSVSLFIQKLRKSFYLGSLTISSPLAFAEGLLNFFKLFFKKEGFLRFM